VTAVRELAERLGPDTDNLVVLGIGGSGLGAIALQSALNPPTWNLMSRPARNGPRLFVLDNIDPALVGSVMDEVRARDPGFARTVVCVVSKSGETAETAAQFMLTRALLKSALGDAYARHIVAITDPSRGTMRSICAAEGYATLPVPEGVGGRFSVLSPVGLFSAAMCGIDIDGLLDGAAEMDDRCSATTSRDNPAAILAWLLVELARRGKTNHVMMPYHNALDAFADWFRQLWAESLGKRIDRDGNEVFAGFTPIKALGATDQHSQIQLYREGPNDKVVGFVVVEQIGDDREIPLGLDAEPLQYLEGATLGTLLAAEKRATEYALVESQRPNFTLTLPRLDARNIGQFIQLWEITTAFAGLMLNIDPYDQPAVETGKVATFGLMGRAGYDDWKSKVDAALAASRWTV
jgi:glucose-6-phosphate isomerase